MDAPEPAPRPRRRRLGRALAGLTVVGALHVAAVVGYGLAARPANADAAVVLGSRVHPDGRASALLRDRLRGALALFRAGGVDVVVVSGGLGREGHQEADVMAEWLIARGVPPARVVRDRDGWTTLHTARNARALAERHGWRSVVVVSSYYHLLRCRLAFWRCGVPVAAAVAAPIRPTLKEPYALLREVAGLYAYLVRPIPARERATERGPRAE